MIQKYIELNRILRKITYYMWDASWPMLEADTESTILNYIEREVSELERVWPKGLTKKPITNLKNKLKLEKKNLLTIIDKDIKVIEDTIDDYCLSQPITDVSVGIVDYLHSTIISSSYSQFRNGQYRDAIFNSIIAIFDLIRKRTKLNKDGAELIDETFSLNRPKLIISELDSESGRNEQKGYMQILKGVYQGIRNPKAHSLTTDLNQTKAAQYLIFASLLARRIEEATAVD